MSPILNDIVDDIQQLLGGNTTVFQIIPEGALRILTNVLKLKGTRAVGLSSSRLIR
ncbi:hypothetical protein CSA56_04510 [candidate division KSB3 bacterium]|uniref:Cache 3/Cache 2 fusion domain-containing protein n=1 Tax=candidate division KSB3 bacterium TaxID=2044937 RepID=A0A2G6KI85_9BACT|nr:MAG: hypothetical protein CSA56_04510 [candidate division KSB3 bacterium]